MLKRMDIITTLEKIPIEMLKLIVEEPIILIDIDDPEAYIEIKRGILRVLKPKNWKNDDYTQVVLYERSFTESTKILHLVK